MLVLDTNVYLDMAADAAVADRIGATVETFSESIGLSSVVVAELLAGTQPADRPRAHRWIFELFSDAEIVTPAHEDWLVAGRALQQLGGDAVTTRRSFWNDLLIAASCVRVGTTLMTRNVEDFDRIRRVIPVSILPRPE